MDSEWEIPSGACVMDVGAHDAAARTRSLSSAP